MKYVFVLLIIISLLACSKPQGFDYRDFRNFKIEKLGFNRSAISMDLVYYNPNNFGVQLRNIDCDVYVENNYLGKFQLDTLMRIPKKAEFTVPAKVEIDMKNVLKNSLTVLFSKEILVAVKGTAKAGKGGVFFNVPVNYEGRHKLEF